MDKEVYKYIFYIIVIFILYDIILRILNSKCYSEYYTFGDPIIHILITRFKEQDITQIIEPFLNINNVIIYIYNKGKDIPKGIPENNNNIKIINIPNLGWDSYAYLKHVIENYDNLPNYIVNLHASAPYLEHKRILFLQIKDKVLNIKNESVQYYGGDLSSTPLNFKLDNWQATLTDNKSFTDDFKTSKIYPLNNWLKSKINEIPSSSIVDNTNLICNYFGMFIVNKSKILKYSKAFYSDILEEISVWQSEVNHYLERSWYTFYNN